MLFPLGRVGCSLPSVRVNSRFGCRILCLSSARCVLVFFILDCPLSAGSALALYIFVSPAPCRDFTLIAKNILINNWANEGMMEMGPWDPRWHGQWVAIAQRGGEWIWAGKMWEAAGSSCWALYRLCFGAEIYLRVGWGEHLYLGGHRL